MRTKRASKTLSLFLAFCMVLSMLPMSAFAETSDVEIGTNEDELELPFMLAATSTMDIDGQTGVSLGADASGTGWTWTATTNTLTLNSSYQGGYIKFECADTDTINLSCNGAVTVNKGSAYAIECNGSLVIKDDSQLTLSGGLRAYKNIDILGTMGNINNSGGPGIDVEGSVTIYGTVGNITSTTHAIYAKGGLTISTDAVVGKIGAGGTSPSSGTYGVYTSEGSVVINGSTGDISGTEYGIRAGSSVTINGTTGAISSTHGSNTTCSGIRTESGGVTINGETGAISGAGGYGICADNGSVLMSGKTGDITGAKADGIFASGSITISPSAVVGNIVGAQNSISTDGDVTIGGKTGNITGASSSFGGGIYAGRNVIIPGETGDITSANSSIPAIGAVGDVSIIGNVGKIEVIVSSGGSGSAINAGGNIQIINSVTVSSFNGAFNKAPTTLPSFYSATWSDNEDGSSASIGNTYTWSNSHKYVKIEKGTSAPTVSGFRAERISEDRVNCFFTPSTTGKYGAEILKKTSSSPTDLSMFSDMNNVEEFKFELNSIGATATDILVAYLQIENTEGVKSQIYSFEVPAYTAPTDAGMPNISNHPQSAVYMQNGVAFDLLVNASSPDRGTLSYQWHSNTTNSTSGGVPIDGAIYNFYTPPTTTVGTTYYYCVVTNTNNKATTNKTSMATTNIAAVTVNASITITKHPQDVTVTQGSINDTLTAEAVANNGKSINYQWRLFVGGIGSDNTQPLLGETSNTLDIPKGLTAGTYKYLCVFNTDGTDYVDSEAAIVTVKSPSSGGSGGGSGGSGGGSSTPPPTTLPPQAPPNQPVTTTIPDPSDNFTDVAGHWAKESIDYVVGKELLFGTSETTFAPNTAMTRGMLVTALGRLAGADVNGYTDSSFIDVNTDSPFYSYIQWAYSKGIVQGIGNNEFAPDRAITREEIAVILQNYADATGYQLPANRSASAFADASSIGSAYMTAVTAMQQAGIMIGDQNNKFNPKASATRAEVSSMLHRYMKLTMDTETAQN